MPFRILVSTVLDVYPEADCCVTGWFCFLRSLHAVSLAAALLHAPPNGAWGSGFQSLHIPVSSRYFCLSIFSVAILLGVRCYFQSLAWYSFWWQLFLLLYLKHFISPDFFKMVSLSLVFWHLNTLCLTSVQWLSCVRLFVTPWTEARQATLSITNSWSLLRLMSIELVMPSNSLILCLPFSPWPSIFPSFRVFSNESILHIKWPKYWSLSFSISPSNEYSGMISFRMDWLDPLAVKGTLNSLLWYHNSKASTFRHSAFFIVQLSHPYMTTGKTVALTRWTFVGKIMSLLFNMLSRLVIALLPRSKRLLILWLQSPYAVILEPPKIKSVTVSTVFPSICHEVTGPCHDLSFLNVEF